MPDPRLPELFAEAVELEGNARAAWLDSLRKREPRMAREVEELLAAATAGERRFSAPLLDALEADPAPERLDDYRILREIGRGGMGRVFLAEQEGAAFRRQVALKVIDRAAVGHDTGRRLRDEVRILASLEHPGIARFLDGGQTREGAWFLALEYVEGESLDVYVAGARLDLRRRVELFLQILDAVDFAHRRLIVHRDLKPGNVMVDRNGRAKLLDFGVSKILEPGVDEATRTEQRAFTPAYASPEQLRGERTTVATDVFSLGVMLYEMLAGRRPFDRRAGDSLSAPGGPADRDPAPPSTAARQGPASRSPIDDEVPAWVHWRDLAGDLDAITLKALRTEPEHRYRSAADMAEDLRRWLRGEPVEARRGGRRYRLGKFVRRHRAPVTFGSMAVVALLCGTVIAVLQARASGRERDRALEELRRAEISNDLSSFMLSVAAPTEGSAQSKEDVLATAEGMIDRRFAADPALRVHLLLALADRYDENYNTRAWTRTARKAYALSRRLAERRLRALASCTWAGVRAEEGEADIAKSLLAEAYADLAGESGTAAEEAFCRNAETRVAFRQGDAENAVRAAERGLALERGRNGPPGRELHALSALALAYSSAGRYVDSDRVFAELMRGFGEQGRERTQGAVINATSWANIAHSAGQMVHAVELHERAVDLARQVYPDQGVQPAVLASYARALAAVGRLDEALAIAEESIAQARRAEESWPLPYALRVAATVETRAGRLEQAQVRLDELAALVSRKPKPGVSDLLALDQVGAQVSLARGDAAGAVLLARQGRSRLEAAGRPAAESVILDLLASASNAAGDFSGALDAARQRLAYVDSIRGGFPYSHQVGLALLEIGIAQLGLGDPDGARESLDQAITNLHATVGDRAPDLRRASEARRRIDG